MKRRPAKQAKSTTPHAELAGLDAVEAIRRLALAQFRIAQANAPGAIEGASDRPLHAFRGGIRRLRVLLKLLGKLPDMEAADLIGTRLGRLTTALGPARDHDVLLARMRAFERSGAGGTGRSWKRFKQHQLEQGPRHRKQVKRVLSAARYRELMDDTSRLLTQTLARRGRRRAAGPIETFAARRLTRLARKIFTTDMPGDPREREAIHTLRKLYRRARYTSEYFGPLLGPHTTRLARKLKRTTDALGTWRDAELALEQLAAAPGTGPRQFTAALKAERKRAIKQAATAVRKLQAPAACRDLLAELRAFKP